LVALPMFLTQIREDSAMLSLIECGFLPFEQGNESTTNGPGPPAQTPRPTQDLCGSACPRPLCPFATSVRSRRGCVAWRWAVTELRGPLSRWASRCHRALCGGRCNAAETAAAVAVERNNSTAFGHSIGEVKQTTVIFQQRFCGESACVVSHRTEDRGSWHFFRFIGHFSFVFTCPPNFQVVVLLGNS
jgi:hypothetical protein